MLKRIANNRDKTSLAGRLRLKRFAIFTSLVAKLQRPVRILDIGGTQNFWEVMGVKLGDGISVELLNLQKEPVSLPGMTSVAGDARKIPMPSDSFDVVFSNSVIEHLGRFGDQKLMADEVRRLGPRYFIQTPNRYFPIEPHFLVPFFQFLPAVIRIWMVRNFTVGWQPREPDYREASKIVNNIRLLTRQELLSLFPDATLLEETVLGIRKSFIACGGWEGNSNYPVSASGHCPEMKRFQL